MNTLQERMIEAMRASEPILQALVDAETEEARIGKKVDASAEERSRARKAVNDARHALRLQNEARQQEASPTP